jgi:hypothetical protein
MSSLFNLGLGAPKGIFLRGLIDLLNAFNTRPSLILALSSVEG